MKLTGLIILSHILCANLYCQAENTSEGYFQKFLPNHLVRSVDKNKINEILKKAIEYDKNGVVDTAILYLQAGVELTQSSSEFISERAEFFRRLGGLYLRHSNLPHGIYFYEKATELAMTFSDKGQYVQYMAELGSAYMANGEFENAKKCYHVAKDYAELKKDSPLLVRSLNSLGDLSRLEKDYESAIHYHEMALNEYFTQTGHRREYWACTSLGKIYAYQNDCAKAKTYFDIVINDSDSVNLINLSAQAYLNLALCDKNNGQYEAAIKKCHTALELSSKLPDIDLQASISKNLSSIYELNGNYKNSLSYYKLFKTLSDSIETTDQIKRIAELEFKEKESSLLAEMQKNKQLLLTEKKYRAAESKTFTLIILAALLGFLLTLIYGLSIYKNLQKNKAQNKIISEQKQDILNSIHYAKRIQQAILPSEKSFKSAFPNSFILYLPKDIVAGDFYWLEKIEDTVLFGVADCTGHGVPGAMVSVICNSGLNRCCRELKIKDPGKILDKTSEFVVAEFEKSDSEVKDGMDISLCSWKGNQLLWAGANNPLWIIRDKKCIEFKPDKRPIGKFYNTGSFTTNHFELMKNDLLYLFTDGFSDQFGGEKGKKFKLAQLQKLVIEISDLDLESQKSILLNTFTDWKGKLEQVDDVCMVGIKY